VKPEPWVCQCGSDPCCIDIHETVDYSLVGRSSMPFAGALLEPGWWKKYQVPWPAAKRRKWEVRQYEIKPAWAALYNLRHPDVGMHVEPGEYTRLIHDGWETVMSDTPSEIQDHLEFIDRAHGRVLINGLGLGMALRAILNKNDGLCIEHVDVVEKSADVLALMQPHFAKDHRVTFYHGDAYEIRWPRKTAWHVAWHDIWSSIDPDDLADHKRLMRRYQNRVNWQSCWKHGWLSGFQAWRKQRDLVDLELRARA
jgi:hypothetical protein